VDIEFDGKTILVRTRLFNLLNALVHIDPEFCFPSVELFAFYLKYLGRTEFGTNKYDALVTPPFGSFRWIYLETRKMGDHGDFFEVRLGSQNPIMRYLFDYFIDDREFDGSIPIDPKVFEQVLGSLTELDYGILSYGKDDWRIYTVEAIQESREILHGILADSSTDETNLASRLSANPLLLNHHAWCGWAAYALMTGKQMMLRDFIAVKDKAPSDQ